LFLLACARHGFVPVHGLYSPETDARGSYCWAQPQAALLVAPAPGVQIGIAAPQAPWLGRPLRLEVRIEDETLPRVVFAVSPGKTVPLRLPLRGTDLARASILVRLTAGNDFVPSDAGKNADSRLLAYQLRGVKGGAIPEECLQVFLMGRSA
jgi:hypothetical protein